MSTTTHRLFRHMAWANQMVYQAVQDLPDEALGAFIINPEWTAGRILQHIVDGAEWYRYCLTGERWNKVDLPNTMSEIAGIATTLAKLDADVASQAVLPDVPLTITEGSDSWQNLRSTILAEAIYHATEHRAQLLDALESKGFVHITLDEIDLWCFEKHERFERQETK